MAQCNNCNRTGKLVMQTVEPANQSAGMSTPWVFRFYLCRWHLAAWNRTRRPGHKKLVPVEYQSNDALLSAPPRRTAMKHNIYTVHAYRWGDRERHSYLVGVYSKKHAALKTAEAEAEWRGGKYECEVIEWIPDGRNEDGSPGMPYKTILPLPPVNTLEARKRGNGDG